MLAAKQDKLKAGAGIQISNDNTISTAATDETVHVSISTEVSGVSVEGLVINVYYNDSSQVSDTVTTDANGSGTLVVPRDYKYKMVFPSIQGCKDVVPVVHYASLVERSVEVEYEAESVASERVRVKVYKRSAAADAVFASAEVDVTVDGTTTSYTTDSSGVAELYVPVGSSYTVSCPAVEGWRTPASQTYTASKSVRGITMKYLYVTSALLIVDADGTEWIPDDFYAAVEAGTKENSDAKMVEFVTDALVDANGVFAFDIDMFATDGFPANKTWAGSNVQFNSIPLNGNASNQPYYYDGLTASKLIQAEGDERNISTNFVDACLALTRTLNDNVLHEGFGGSTGQWAVAWANRAAFDDIVAHVRSTVLITLTALTGAKWTSTQNAANAAYYWGTSASNVNKGNSYRTVVFFAFLNS